MNRRPQLDALRGIAVALVVVHHWTAWGHDLGLGNIGVQLFFVLSGFLITGILLDQRAALGVGDTRLHETLICFFMRRSARIWPVMFLTLALVWLAGDRFERQDDMLWHALFSSNALFFQRGEFGSSLAHYWSLAVELQFYLIWPFIIFYTPQRWLEAVILAMIIVGPISRYYLVSKGYTHFAEYNVLPFANLDSLGVGGLMAVWLRLDPLNARKRWGAYRIASIAAAVGLAIIVVTANPANLAQSLYAILFGGLIVAAYGGFGGFPGRFLEYSPLVTLGAISFGVYVYHVFTPRAVGMALRTLDAPLVMHSGAPLIVLSALLTLVVATASWRLMERPIIMLGRRDKRTAPAKGPAVGSTGVRPPQFSDPN